MPLKTSAGMWLCSWPPWASTQWPLQRIPSCTNSTPTRVAASSTKGCWPAMGACASWCPSFPSRPVSASVSMGGRGQWDGDCGRVSPALRLAYPCCLTFQVRVPSSSLPLCLAFTALLVQQHQGTGWAPRPFSTGAEGHLSGLEGSAAESATWSSAPELHNLGVFYQGCNTFSLPGQAQPFHR